MSTTTIKPTAVSINDWIRTGGASNVDAITDGSDASYYTHNPGSQSWLYASTFGSPSVPAGAVIRSVTAMIRVARVGGTAGGLRFVTQVDSGVAEQADTNVTWSTPTDLTLKTYTRATAPSAAQILLRNNDYYSDLRVYETWMNVLYVAQPEVNVTAPAGTITDTNQPTAEWEGTLDADGGAQVSHEVKIFTAAQYGAGGFDPATSTPHWTSGIVSSALDSYDIGTTLADGTYRAYVRIAQSVGGDLHWSDWDYSTYEIDVALPAVPFLDVFPVDDLGAIGIEATGESGDATTDAIELQRSTDVGATWHPVRLTTDTAGVVEGVLADATDYEASNGVTMVYRARALHNYGGVLAASDWVSASTFWASTDWWLKNPLSPVRNAIVAIDSYAGHRRAGRLGVFQPLGRDDQIVVADGTGRGGRQGTIRFVAHEQDALDALDDLLDGGGVLLLHGPAGHHEPDRYIRFGDEDNTRLIDKAFVEGRIVTLQWYEVIAPVGAIDEFPEIGS